MAVYTEVSFDEAASLVARLSLGELKAMQGIRGGIENTNYFLDCAVDGQVTAQFVLTVFERLSYEQLPFYLQFMKHLAGRGIPVPDPKPDASGSIVHTLQGKPAAVVERLPGRHYLAPDSAHCASVGAVLARMHRAGADFTMHQPNPRGLSWWIETTTAVLPFLTPSQRELIESELAYQQHLDASPAHSTLPRGPIHADLFRDNVMFEPTPSGDQLSGLFDFYFAGVDALALDIAVCLNDWCIDLDTGRLDEVRATAFVAAYDAVRPLSSCERRLMAALMRAAALRFWLSRLWDFYLPRNARLLTAHDPAHFERVLRERVNVPWHPASASVVYP